MMDGRVLRSVGESRESKILFSLLFIYTLQKIMAQIAIREYDAKRMFATFRSTIYQGYLIE